MFLLSHFMQKTFFHVTENVSVTELITTMAHVAVTITNSPGQRNLGTKIPPLFSYLSQRLPTQLLSLHRDISTPTGQLCVVAAWIPQEWHRPKLPQNQRGDHGGHAGHWLVREIQPAQVTGDLPVARTSPSDSLEPQG